MELTPRVKAQIAAEAVEWHIKFRSGTLLTAEREAFSEWLSRSPTHIEEFLAVSCVGASLSALDPDEFSAESLIEAARTAESDNVVQLETQPSASTPASHMRPTSAGVWRRVGLAALLIFGAGTAVWYATQNHEPEFRTAIGEQRSVTLADGSVMFLNTNSEARTHWTATERRIDLLKGEARFSVAKNPARPFLVFTADASARALGTVFNVRIVDSGTAVAVIEGRVRVTTLAAARGGGATKDAATTEQAGAASGAPRSPSIELAAGQRATVVQKTIQPNTGPLMESVAAWPERRLVFREDSLADVVAQFNRYRTQPIVVDDAELAGLKISGVFDSTDPDSLLIYLKSFETVELAPSDDGSLHLSRHASPQSRNARPAN